MMKPFGHNHSTTSKMVYYNDEKYKEKQNKYYKSSYNKYFIAYEIILDIFF